MLSQCMGHFSLAVFISAFLMQIVTHFLYETNLAYVVCHVALKESIFGKGELFTNL